MKLDLSNINFQETFRVFGYNYFCDFYRIFCREDCLEYKKFIAALEPIKELINKEHKMCLNSPCKAFDLIEPYLGIHYALQVLTEPLYLPALKTFLYRTLKRRIKNKEIEKILINCEVYSYWYLNMTQISEEEIDKIINNGNVEFNEERGYFVS